MAKRKPVSGDNIRDLERGAFRVDELTGDKFKAVCDETAHAILEAILNQLGGSSEVEPTIYNVNIISANTEQSQALPANTKGFIIKSRNRGEVKLAYASGGTSAAYLTLPRGTSFEDTQFYASVTLYFQSTTPGDVIEIVAYS